MHAHDSQHTDRGLIYINRILIACSMCLSGYFGWALGEGVFPLNIVLAAMCGSVAVGVSLMFERAAGYNVHGYSGNALVCWIIGCLFLTANVIFDYSAAAALRDAVSVQAVNANNRAGDVRDQIGLVKKNITDAKATVAWQATLQPPASYEAEIANLEGNRTIMARSKGCADQTLPDTKAHCGKLSAARANLAMAQQKSAYETQVDKWETELGALAARSLDTETHKNPAVAQVKSFMAWATGRLDISEDQVAWGQLGIMALMTVLVNAGLAFLGNEIGTQRALNHRGRQHPGDYEDNAPEPQRPTRALTYRRADPPPPAAVAEPAPIPLQPAPGGERVTSTETIIIGGAGGVAGGRLPEGSPETAELLARSQAATERVQRLLRDMKALGNA
jgi:hypothetical protein